MPPASHGGGAPDDRESATVRELRAALARAEDEARRATRVRDAFLAAVSHELRTPLTAVVGTAQVLLHETQATEGADAARQRDGLRTILSASAGLLARIDGVLEYSEIDSGPVLFVDDDFELHTVLAEVCDDARALAAAKGLSLETTLPTEGPWRLRGDRFRLRQLVARLLTHALETSDAGTVGLHASVSAPSAGTRRVRIRVRDASASAEDPGTFATIDPTSVSPGGSRLALAVARALAERMDGTLGYAFVPGAGGTVTADVTFGTPHANRPPSSSSSSSLPRVNDPTTTTSAGTKRVPHLLVVDDTAINRLVIGRMLASLGFTSDEADGGASALVKMAERTYDAVLLDCRMAGMDGYETVAHIRARERERDATAVRTPVIAVTAHALRGDRERCLAAGMDDYLAKPVTRETLCAVLERWAPSAVTSAARAVGGGSQARVTIAPGIPTFDRAMLDSMRTLQVPGKPDVVAELVDIFVDDVTRRLEAVHGSIGEGDTASLERLSHSLKGACASFGAMRLGRLAERLESAHGSADARSVLDSMIREFGAVKRVLRR